MLSSEHQLSDALRSVGGNVRSPLALTGIMLQILRHRFHQRHKLPYYWIPVDANDKKTMFNEHPDSTLRIEAGGPSLEDQGYVKPGIYVLRQPIHVQQLAVDDMSSFRLATGDRTFLARGATGFTFVCEADDKGQSSALADLTMATFMMGANLIERTFRFHKLGPFSLSATTSTRKEKEIFETHVSVGLQYDLKWANLNLAPMFKEIVLKSSENEQYFFETYTKSILTEQE
jgi:hypothetical protein